MQHKLYQRKVDVDMLNAVKNVLADVSSFRSSCSDEDTFLRRLAFQHEPVEEARPYHKTDKIILYNENERGNN